MTDHTELLEILSMPSPSVALRLNNGFVETVLPEMLPMICCTQNKYHSFDVWEHTLRVVDAVPCDNIILRLGALFHDIGKPASKGVHPVTGDATFYDHENIGAGMTDAVMSRIGFSDEDRLAVVHLVRHHFIKYEKDWSDSSVRRWVKKVGSKSVSQLCQLAKADIIGKGHADRMLDQDVIDELLARAVSLQEVKVIVPFLNVSGKDVMDHLNVLPGPLVGKVLAALTKAVTEDPELNNKDELLKMASVMLKQ